MLPICACSGGSSLDSILWYSLARMTGLLWINKNNCACSNASNSSGGCHSDVAVTAPIQSLHTFTGTAEVTYNCNPAAQCCCSAWKASLLHSQQHVVVIHLSFQSLHMHATTCPEVCAWPQQNQVLEQTAHLGMQELVLVVLLQQYCTLLHAYDSRQTNLAVTAMCYTHQQYRACTNQSACTATADGAAKQNPSPPPKKHPAANYRLRNSQDAATTTLTSVTQEDDTSSTPCTGLNAATRKTEYQPHVDVFLPMLQHSCCTVRVQMPPAGSTAACACVP